MSTQFRLLGAIETRSGGGVLEIGHLRKWCVLAVLLLDANRAVPVDQLMDRVWGERPPARARETLYGYVSRLRTALAPAADVRITRRPEGYLLTVDPDAVDVHRFHRLVTAARGTRDGEKALTLYEQALGLWRGEAFPVLDTPWLSGVRAALDRARLSAELDRNDLALACGRHSQVLDAMSAAAIGYPLDERLAGQLMLALYRAGRPGEALECYRRLRARLADELGIEPGEPLRELHRRVLRSDPAPVGLPSTAAVTGPATEPDRQGGAAVGVAGSAVGSGRQGGAAVGMARSAAEPDRQGDAAVGVAGSAVGLDQQGDAAVGLGGAAVGPDRQGGVAVGSDRPGGAAVPVPRQVPSPPHTFTGREAELAELSAPAAISAIIGPGGVGKTWLAQRWAHLHRSRYPDGQLYVDLRGFDPAGAPVAPSVAVRGFLDALGVVPEGVPADLDAQAAMYRSLVADKRLLIVLDNARDSAHASRLLPGTASCTVLVTSRHQLAGLVTTHGARPLALGLLTDPEAHRLLAEHLGHRRVTAEADAVDGLLRHCAGLPLALGIVAARAAVHPGLPLAALATELDAAATRLDALDAGELAVNLRAVLSCSTASLEPSAGRLFALLGLAPGPDVGLAGAASLAGLPIAETRLLLRKLTAAHLLAEPGPGRYRMHDLLRLYAAEQAEPLSERSAALRRIFDYYLHAGYAANRLLAPGGDTIEPVAPAPGVSIAPVGDHGQALAWFAAEHANLLAAIDQAGAGLDTHVWQLAWTISPYLDRHAHWRDRATVHTAALAAAQRLGDRSAQAFALRGLARAQIWFGHLEDARRQLHRALKLLDDLDDPAEQAHLYRTLARSYARAGQPRQALEHDERALRLYEAAGHRCGQATVLNAIGWHRAHLAEYEQALPFCEQALVLQEEIGDRRGAAATSDSLGYIHGHLGHYDQAVACYRWAVEVFGDLGDRNLEAGTLTNLGDTYAAAGQSDLAGAARQRAASIRDELGVPTGRTAGAARQLLPKAPAQTTASQRPRMELIITNRAGRLAKAKEQDGVS